jgi:hypothetical protein
LIGAEGSRQSFDTNCLTDPPFYTWGKAGVGLVRGPGLSNLALAFFKSRRIAGRRKIEFRAGFFNAFNTPHLADHCGQVDEKQQKNVFTIRMYGVAPAYGLASMSTARSSFAATSGGGRAL